MRRSLDAVCVTLPVVLSAAAMIFFAATVQARSGASGQGTSPLIITERASGKTFTFTPKTNARLRLSSHESWTPPHVRGKAIQLVAVDYFRDPGFSEWVIHILGTGRATITSSGEPNCPSSSSCTGAPQQFAIKIVVRKQAVRHTPGMPTR
jgi:hypothetical protein